MSTVTPTSDSISHRVNTPLNRYLNDKTRLRPLIAPVIFDLLSKYVISSDRSSHYTHITVDSKSVLIDVTGSIQSGISIQDMKIESIFSCSIFNSTYIDRPVNNASIGTAYNMCTGCIAYIITSNQCIPTSIIGNEYEQFIPMLTVSCPSFANVIGAPLVNHYGHIVGIVATQEQSGLCCCYYIDIVADIISKNRTCIGDIGIQWKVISDDRVLITNHTSEVFTNHTDRINNRFVLSSSNSRSPITSILASIHTAPESYNFKCNITDLLTNESKRISVIVRGYRRRKKRPTNRNNELDTIKKNITDILARIDRRGIPIDIDV